MVGVIVLAAAAVGLWLSREDTPALVVAPCPTPSAVKPVLVLPRTQEVRLRLLNGTARNGLAGLVAGQLAGRGFVVLSQGNSAAAVGGASQVRYGAGAGVAARLLSFHVLGSVVVRDAASPSGVVTVVLGSDFRRLATPAEVAAAVQGATAPAATARPTGPTPSPTCAR
jgi:hypothetical protein